MSGTMRQLDIGFHHTAGGDSLLPASDRGFFDGYTVTVTATSYAEAERIGEEAMRDMVSATYPDWPRRAVDDLCAEVWEDGQMLDHNPDWDVPFAD